MRVVLSPRAEKQLKKLSKIDQIAIAKKIRSLRDYPLTQRAERLKGFKNIYRVRIGNYRIVFKKSLKEIYIVLIHHRKDIYRLLRQLVD